MICPACGAEQPEGPTSRFCVACARALPVVRRRKDPDEPALPQRCGECGHEVTSARCRICGSRVTWEEPS